MLKFQANFGQKYKRFQDLGEIPVLLVVQKDVYN